MAQFYKVTPRIEHYDWLEVHSQITSDPHLEQFLQRAKAAGEREERVTMRVHQRFSLTHISGDDEFVGV